MKTEYAQLIGNLIGLARATDGNEHLINPSATALIRACLQALGRNEADLEYFTARIQEEKQKMVPNCFVCANPCGRTSPFDLDEIPEGEIRMLKYELLDTLFCNADKLPEDILYRDLVIIGLEDYEKEDLLSLIQEIS